MKGTKNSILLCILLCIPLNYYSLESNSIFLNDINQPISNSFAYGFSRTPNLLYLDFIGDYSYKSTIGQIGLFQRYKGDAGLNQQLNNTDDEQMTLFYRSPALKRMEIVNINNLTYAADNIRSTNNTYQKYNTNIGLNYNFLNSSYIMGLAGFESNTQASIEANGITYGLKSKVAESIFDNYRLSSDFLYDASELNDGRNNRDLSLNTIVMGTFDHNEQLMFQFNYEDEIRDFISYLVTDRNNLVESRDENLFATSIGTIFNFNKSLNFQGSVAYSQKSIKRYYNDYLKDYNYTGVEKKQSLINLDVNAIFKMQRDDFKSSLHIRTSVREEQNTLKNSKLIEANRFESIKMQESSLDNSINDLSLANSTQIRISIRDSLAWNVLYSINHYNTPDEINNDDKDESNFVSNIYYSRRISDFLTLNLLAEYSDRHLVFLRAERSSQNNHNKVIRFSPSLFIRNKRFEYNPRLEVLANYTVYDFEAINASVKSYSFRQFSYSDSLNIPIANNILLHTENTFRYFLNGILYWDSFSEYPQMENIEYQNTINLWLMRNTISCKVGMRYMLQHRNDLSLNTKEMIYRHMSIGPDVGIRKIFKSSSSIILTGWYERQDINSSIKWIPNVELRCNIRL